LPEIQPKAGGLGAILSSAPQLLDSLTTLTDRLTELLNPENQKSLGHILENTDRMTKSLADASPRVDAVLAQLQATLAQADLTLAQFQETLGTTDRLLNKEGSSLAGEMRQTLASARKAADSLQATLEDTRPAARELSESTLPAAEAAIRDLRRTTAALRQMTESVQNQGAGSLLKGKQLPDYKP
jgi:phospholipid/cholesterol/gamma-HCH transport system substrate-binding protein